MAYGTTCCYACFIVFRISSEHSSLLMANNTILFLYEQYTSGLAERERKTRPVSFCSVTKKAVSRLSLVVVQRMCVVIVRRTALYSIRMIDCTFNREIEMYRERRMKKR